MKSKTMKITDAIYNPDEHLNDSFTVYYEDEGNELSINIDMDYIIDEIAGILSEFSYLIDGDFDFYLNPCGTINIRFLDRYRHARNTTVNLIIILQKQLQIQDESTCKNIDRMFNSMINKKW